MSNQNNNSKVKKTDKVKIADSDADHVDYVDQIDHKDHKKSHSVKKVEKVEKAEKVEKVEKMAKVEKVKSKTSNTDHNVDDSDIMQSLLNVSAFDTPAKKKITPKQPKSKEIEIDMENDSQEEIIRKLVLTVKKLQAEMIEYKEYVEGSYCTCVEFNRYFIDNDKAVAEISSRLEEIEKMS